ncbi:MAG: cation diffusion facilitator family transporter, partial [Candidatus Natronoplasma sp.]
MKGKNKTGKRVAVGSIVINVAIFAVKGFIALQIGSLALLSDAVHSISDSASSVAVYLGLKVSERPPDKDHPFGHGRADQVAVLAVGIILFFAAISFLAEGIESLLVGPIPLMMAHNFYIYIIFTAVVKEIMGEVSYFVGKKSGSESLKADAWHHRADALTTVLVIGAIYASQIGFPRFDPLVGIGIALLLSYIGFSYIKRSTHRLLGREPSEEIIKEIKRIGENTEGVKGVHDIKVHDYGDRKAVSLHMDAQESSLRSAHERSHDLKKMLEERFDLTAEVHFDPKIIPEKKIVDIIKEEAEKSEKIVEAHQVRVTESQKEIMISMHV